MPIPEIYTYIPTTRAQYEATFTVDPVLATVVIGALLLAVMSLGVITLRRAWSPAARRRR